MEYRIEKLNEQTWLIEEYCESASAYMYLLAGKKKALLIDTGFGSIPLTGICRKLTEFPIAVALSHGHVDHIGGTGAFEDVWLSEEDKELYKEHSEESVRRMFTQDRLYPVKEECNCYIPEMVFELGDREISVIKTPGHSVGSVCFLDRKNRWLFTGDTCCKAHVLLQMKHASSMEEYRSSLRKLIEMESMYDITWPGHHSKPVGKDVIHDFLFVTDGILNGSISGTVADLPMGKAKLAEYKEIGIEY